MKMCVIIASEQGKLPTDYALGNAIEHNPDGWGVAVAIDGHVQVDKGTQLSSLKSAIHRAEGKAFIAHLRFATHGLVDVHNTHPFRVQPGLFLAHNGILDITPSKKDWSDTKEFVVLISGLLRQNPGWLERASFTSDLEEFIGPGNKLALLSADGRIRLANEKAGSWKDGIWYSNLYSLDPVGWYDFSSSKYEDYEIEFESDKESGYWDHVWHDDPLIKTADSCDWRSRGNRRKDRKNKGLLANWASV